MVRRSRRTGRRERPVDWGRAQSRIYGVNNADDGRKGGVVHRASRARGRVASIRTTAFAYAHGEGSRNVPFAAKAFAGYHTKAAVAGRFAASWLAAQVSK